MLSGIGIGFVLGLYAGWKLRAWWMKSSIKKATDVVGSVAEKPARLAKGLRQRFKELRDRWSGKKDKEKKP